MRHKILSYGLAGLFIASPALAATHYYVVQRTADKSCSVSTVKPDGKLKVPLGQYKTRAEAKAAIKTAAECPKK